MKKLQLLLFIFLCSMSAIAQIRITDSINKIPVSYATISFGNGNGLFADDEGQFTFTKKLYPDIDSLFISALGYKSLKLNTSDLTNQLYMEPQADELDEVVIDVKIKRDRKFKVEKLKPYLDDDYYKCWLPTIESEIAVYVPKTSTKDQKVKHVLFPIALESRDWKKRKRSNSDKKPFSTLFKVQFYSQKDGFPDKPLTYETIVFRATEKNGDKFELDVEAYNIFIPKDGLFISLQVLGYTDKSGKLLPNKKYKEIKTKSGIVKIPTNFRPLLPFTDGIKAFNTYIKRVFINGNKWVQFKKGNGFKSSLLDNNLYNYGIGLNIHTYKDQ